MKTIQRPATPRHGAKEYPLPIGKQSNMKTETVLPRRYGMGLTAHQPPAYTNGEESIGKPNTKKTNIKMYGSKETLR